MSDERAFIDHIIAHPDDDAPRLVFADWLDERGRHARAEFIRVQCERASLPAWDARQVRLGLREKELHARLKGELTAELPYASDEREGPVCRRGFPAELSFVSCLMLRAFLPTWAASMPVDAVSVRAWGLDREREQLPAVRNLRELRLPENLSAERLALLADSSLLSSFRVLNLGRSEPNEPALRRLLASPHLSGLRVLRVGFGLATSDVPRILAEVDLPALEELDISGAAPYAEYLTGGAVAWPGLARLWTLRLNYNRHGRDGLRTLLASPQCAGLKSLSLRGNGLDADACAAFADATPGLRLDALDIGDNSFGDAGAAALAGAACLSELKELTIDRCAIGRPGAAALAEAPFMSTLRVLRTGSNSFAHRGLQAILAAAPPHLHTLSLSANDLNDRGLTTLAKSPASDVFLDLDLAQNGLTDTGLGSLGTSPHLRSLLRLAIDTGSPNDDRNPFRRSPLGRRLVALTLRESPEPSDDSNIPF